MSEDKTPHPLDIHVGARIRLRRKLLGLSQTDLADAIGLTFQQCQKYERGSNRVSASKLYEIAKALRVPFAYFVEGYSEHETDEDSQTENEVSNFLHTTEGIELASTFPTIPSLRHRKAVLGMVRALSGGEA